MMRPGPSSSCANQLPPATWQAMGPTVHNWANLGHAASAKRPGVVDVASGSPADYRALMTPIAARGKSQ